MKDGDYKQNFNPYAKSPGIFVNRFLTSNEHIVWLQPSSWSAIILIKWKVSFAVDNFFNSALRTRPSDRILIRSVKSIYKAPKVLGPSTKSLGKF